MNLNKDVISKSMIEQGLNKCPFSTNIIVLDTVDSTNTYAKTLAQAGVQNGTCIIAKTQTNGRGRLGRKFFSPSDTGIYMSIIIRPETEYETSFPYTIAACVAVCNALENSSEEALGIKWVNDIFLNGRKVCGILTEGGTLSGSSKTDYFVVGIGINTSVPDNGFPEEIKEIAGAVSTLNVSKNQIIASVISNLFDLYKNTSIDEIIREYKQRSFVLGKTISYVKNGKSVTGIAEDIKNDGSLIVRISDGTSNTLISGEVSLSDYSL